MNIINIVVVVVEYYEYYIIHTRFILVMVLAAAVRFVCFGCCAGTESVC